MLDAVAGSYSTILSARSTISFVRCKRGDDCGDDCDDADDDDSEKIELVDPKLLELLPPSEEEKLSLGINDNDDNNGNGVAGNWRLL